MLDWLIRNCLLFIALVIYILHTRSLERVGGKCKLECEESGVALGKGHEMHGQLVCEMKDGGVSFDNISMSQ